MCLRNSHVQAATAVMQHYPSDILAGWAIALGSIALPRRRLRTARVVGLASGSRVEAPVRRKKLPKGH